VIPLGSQLIELQLHAFEMSFVFAGMMLPGSAFVLHSSAGCFRSQGILRERPPLQFCSSSLKSPFIILAVGTVASSVPGSGSCFCNSAAKKKNILSLFLLKSECGSLTGPPMLKPG